MSEEVAILLTFTVVVIGGVALMIAAMTNRRKLREMEHRERLAMIERGIAPAPEADPAGFERATGVEAPAAHGRLPGERYRTIGVVMIGIGVGLAFLLGMVAESGQAGIGVGGAWVALGGASLLNYFLITRARRS